MIFFYLLISVMPLSRHPLWGMFMGELTLVKYLGGICLLYAILYLAVRQSPASFLAAWQARWFLLLAALAMSSFAVSGQWSNWYLGPFFSYPSFLLLFFLTLAVVDTRARFRNVVLVAIGSVALASIYVIREWQKFHSVAVNFRPGWVVGDPNYFTVSALLCLPIALSLLVASSSRAMRLFCLGCAVITLIAVTLAASRGGFLGLLAALLILTWRARQVKRAAAILVLVAAPFALAAPYSPLKRFLNPSHGDQTAVESRQTVWKAGVRMAGEHPLLGIGLGNFKLYVEEYENPYENVKHIAHNSYVEIAAESGIPALIAFLATIFCSLRTLVRVQRGGGDILLQKAAMGMEAGLIGAAVAIFFVSGQYQKLLWMMVFLSICLRSLAASADDSEQPVDDERPIEEAVH